MNKSIEIPYLTDDQWSDSFINAWENYAYRSVKNLTIEDVFEAGWLACAKLTGADGNTYFPDFATKNTELYKLVNDLQEAASYYAGTESDANIHFNNAANKLLKILE
jgi:hypothetical protein